MQPLMDYIVGKIYDVTCAEISDGQDIFYVPVIGEAHKDPQFGVNVDHYHIDGRFNDKNSILKTDHLGRTNNVIGINGDGLRFIQVVIKRKRCKRLTTGIKVPQRLDDFIGIQGTKYEDWYLSMKGKSCKGRKCPHGGTDMLEKDGKLYCPLHNLIWDKEKEIIIEFENII